MRYSKKILYILKLLRVNNYIKNLIIFLPVFFGKSLFDVNNLLVTLYGFINFCLVTSVVYVINDIKDLEKDKKHPKKCKRPIASGKISIKVAFIILAFLIIIACSMCVIGIIKKIYNIEVVLLMLAYIIMNLLYSFCFKKFPIVDIFIIAIGFMLRLYIGSYISNIEISSWLYLTILGGSFYMALGKRRSELTQNKSNSTREVLGKYNYDFLDKNMTISMAFTEMSYALWAVSNENKYMYLTVPIMLFILMRYMYIIEINENAENPVDIIITDKILVSIVTIFVLITVILLYVI